MSWDEAISIAASALVAAEPEKTLWIATRTGPTDETWFALARSAKAMGAPNAAMLGLGASGLADLVGTDAATCGLADWIGTDLLVVWGAHLAIHQPEALRYLSAAKAEGTRVVVVDPAAEHALGSSFGTRLADDLVQIKPGGDEPLAKAVLAMLSRWGVASERCESLDIDALLGEAGVRYNEAEWLARLIARSESMISVWSTGLCLPAAMRAVVKLHLARGLFGRPRCGWMPLDRHSGGPGARSCGLVSYTEGSLPPSLDAVVAIGGLPSDLASAADRIRTRVHIDTAIEPSALLAPADGGLVLLLPATTRYEQPSGGVIMSVERRIRFSPQIQGPPRAPEARPEPLVLAEIVRKARPDRAQGLAWTDIPAIRRAMAAELPHYEGVERLTQEGEFVQWGGPQLLLRMPSRDGS